MRTIGSITGSLALEGTLFEDVTPAQSCSPRLLFALRVLVNLRLQSTLQGSFVWSKNASKLLSYE